MSHLCIRSRNTSVLRTNLNALMILSDTKSAKFSGWVNQLQQCQTQAYINSHVHGITGVKKNSNLYKTAKFSSVNNFIFPPSVLASNMSSLLAFRAGRRYIFLKHPHPYAEVYTLWNALNFGWRILRVIPAIRCKQDNLPESKNNFWNGQPQQELCW